MVHASQEPLSAPINVGMPAMRDVRTIPCPNCGQDAVRIFDRDAEDSCCPGNQLTRTECSACDYVLAFCTLSGAVVEAYAPGIFNHL